jgi:A-macroglobulin TED domain
MDLDLIPQDVILIRQALNFIKSQQDPVTGAFNDENIKAIPSNPDEDSKHRSFHITCFVIQTMCKFNDHIEFESLIEKALNYLKDEADTVDTYDLAFYGYILSITGDPKRAYHVLTVLETESRTDGATKYWNFKGNDEISGKIKI